ncbi:SPX and EXS domain-containing protein 3 [Hypsizygus marmoreus]|uniref:SPX and EXS domain-containing protein 3 n=1 Tax=Hypsizygus marmoreus TaxID=39966 RepID=A0A369K7M3_HYPMA|nr:SPX and EXS domain-containing protein 3 [Hypsizygus marmoreus]
MKFARYLQDTQTPEWKKAYIDYRGLKKRISAIRKAQEGLSESPSEAEDDQVSNASFHDPQLDAQMSSLVKPSLDLGLGPPQAPPTDSEALRQLKRTPKDSIDQPRRSSASRGRSPSLAHVKSITSFRRGRAQTTSSRWGSGQSRPTNPLAALPLHDLLNQLSSTELAFFTTLDAELEKIETFYLAREAEMQARTKMLHEQLDELNDHKKLVQAAHPHSQTSWSSALVTNIKDKLKVRRAGNGVLPQRPDSIELSSHRMSLGSGSLDKGKEREHDEEGKNMGDEKHLSGKHVVLSTDPEDYLYAKKKLKKAVLEHYRGLEVLHNYRILNLTGFRKALKKFEKTTKIPAQQQYMTERIEKSAFASDKTVRNMMAEMETLYATRFARGDKKRAQARLRAGFHAKSHHYSVFRSGIFLGLALPALVSGVHSSFQKSTRDAIPGWDGLLFIYGVLLIPVLFSVLVGVNLLVWARSRINYVFIFELDTRTRMDYREYHEIPSILLAGFCYAFWLSFLRIGAPSISPTIWPLVWLGFAFIIMTDPIPVLYKPSRYWLIRNVGRLFFSGLRRVEFTDFWMGDQFCSLIFSLSNLYAFACVYATNFDISWQDKCGVTSPRWPVAFVLASLPLLFRLLQSVKRWRDSGLITHLINGGKYGSGIVGNLFFYLWRHQGSNGRGTLFALWCLFNAVYSIYASSWDFLMDWSVLRLRARYPLLRPELVYTDQIPFYYIAIITNVLIRFIWILYIPRRGPGILLRTFIGGMLEMLRRWQWNFYRLENEHLGNMDQYRVTREVPLPYSFDEDVRAGADEDDDDGEAVELRSGPGDGRVGGRKARNGTAKTRGNVSGVFSQGNGGNETDVGGRVREGLRRRMSELGRGRRGGGDEQRDGQVNE